MNSIAKIEKDEIVNPEDILLLPSLECSIDSMIPIDPVMCSKCQTLFCSDCIETWKKKSTVCPMRCSPFDTVSIERTIIRDQINRIKVRCRYYSTGCLQGSIYAEKASHELQCRYKPISCPKCNVQVPSILLMEHYKASCQGNLVECFLCEKQMNWENIAKHIESCSFSDPSWCSICFNASHLQENCPFNIVNCPKCNLPEMQQELQASKHVCPILSNENYVNEYHSHLIQRYEDEINKLAAHKEEKMGMSLMKFKGMSNELNQFTSKQLTELKSKKMKIKEAIGYKNAAMKKELERTIEDLKNQNSVIQNEIDKKDKEEVRIKESLALIQSQFLKELNEKSLLLDNELALERKYLVKACQYSHQMKLSEGAIKEIIESISAEEIVREACVQCNETGKMRKCRHCQKNICLKCSQKCSNEKHQQLEGEDNSYCSNCFSKCSKCSKKVCNDCIKKCYSNNCSNIFCWQCYEVNKHQVRGGSQSCKIFKCDKCKKENICIMKTMTHKETRLCWECFSKV